MTDKKIDDALMAFPQNELNADGTVYRQCLGMTLRDYFAAKALSAMEIKDDGSYSKIDFSHDFPRRNAANYATTAYRIADAMLAARGKP